MYAVCALCLAEMVCCLLAHNSYCVVIVDELTTLCLSVVFWVGLYQMWYWGSGRLNALRGPLRFWICQLYWGGFIVGVMSLQLQTNHMPSAFQLTMCLQVLSVDSFAVPVGLLLKPQLFCCWPLVKTCRCATWLVAAKATCYTWCEDCRATNHN